MIVSAPHGNELARVPGGGALRIAAGRLSCRSPMASGFRTCWLKVLPLRLFDQVGVAIPDPNRGRVSGPGPEGIQAIYLL
jgi:hypothetical protein